MSIPDWLAWLVAAVATVVAIRATVRFDVNEWLRDRRRYREEEFRSLCPHIGLTIVDGRDYFRNMYVSPVGTTAWQCQLCGDVLYDQAAADDVLVYWAEHPRALQARMQKINRLAKKLGRA